MVLSIVINISHLFAHIVCRQFHLKYFSTTLFLLLFLYFCILIVHLLCTIVSTLLNNFNYCRQTFIILFDINHLFANNEVLTSIAI